MEPIIQEEETLLPDETLLNTNDSVAYIVEKTQKDFSRELLYKAKEDHLIEAAKREGRLIFFRVPDLDRLITLREASEQKRRQERADQRARRDIYEQNHPQSFQQERHVQQINTENIFRPEMVIQPVEEELFPKCYRCGRQFLRESDYLIATFKVEEKNAQTETIEKRLVYYPVCQDRRCDPTYQKSQALLRREQAQQTALRNNAFLVEGLKQLQEDFTHRIQILIASGGMEEESTEEAGH